MKTHLILLTCVAALASGCGTAPRDGSDQQTHYYALKRPVPASASGVTTVHAAPTAPAAQGPANTAHIVYFDFDDARLQPRYQQIVTSHGEFLRANRHRLVVLEGHTDERGGTEYNVGLAQRRAEQVRRALALMGVPDRQMEAVGLGEEKPASLLQTEEGYQLNRRVEFRYR